MWRQQKTLLSVIPRMSSAKYLVLNQPSNVAEAVQRRGENNRTILQTQQPSCKPAGINTGDGILWCGGLNRDIHSFVKVSALSLSCPLFSMMWAVGFSTYKVLDHVSLFRRWWEKSSIFGNMIDNDKEIKIMIIITTAVKTELDFQLLW